MTDAPDDGFDQVVERNIRALLAVRRAQERRRGAQERAAMAVTRFAPRDDQLD